MKQFSQKVFACMDAQQSWLLSLPLHLYEKTSGVFSVSTALLDISQPFFHPSQSTYLFSWFRFNYQMLLTTWLKTHSPTQTSLLRFFLFFLLRLFLLAAPQSLFLLRLHHGRMPDSLYGNLSHLWSVMLHSRWTFYCTIPNFMNHRLLANSLHIIYLCNTILLYRRKRLWYNLSLVHLWHAIYNKYNICSSVM